ncbi:MAG: class I SAM-dependent methyltransferase [Oscillospiraceae bacterium]|jgi:ubiquinone/menaquinone biosynthesis C-methylase UbiE|nr:class I SAM-dependent methyltransferase [Oscillospiraceae bacterium]
MTNKAKENWNNRSAEHYQSDIIIYEEVIKCPEKAFPVELIPLLKKYVGSFRGLKICVPSSGDNVAAFGFHLLGAKVTSCDYAENQLMHSQAFANKHGWDIEFICQDSMKLNDLRDNEYDLVYTSNGVHVWIDDLPGMYKNFYRILKDGGYNIFFETHPMSRPFDNTTYEVKIRKLYEDIGPFVDDDGEITYAWRTQDFVNAITSAGFTIREMQEFHSVQEDIEAHNYLYVRNENKNKYKWYGDTFDWKVNPWAALPQCLCMCSQKLRMV